MTKTSIGIQELRERIGEKAKAEVVGGVRGAPQRSTEAGGCTLATGSRGAAPAATRSHNPSQ